MQQNIEQQETDAIEIDLGRLLRNLLQIAKKLWFLLLLAIVLGAAAVVFVQEKSYTPSYSAYCTFSVHVVNKATLSDTNSMYSVYYDQDLAEQLDATFSYLINSDFLLDDVKEYLGEKSIDGYAQAHSIEGSNIFVITAYSSTPEKAGALLEALMALYYDAARYVVGDMEEEIIEGPVTSLTPCNTPDRTKGIMLGAILGFLICVGAMVVALLFKQTVFEPSDLEKYLNMQCLGVVPLMQSKRNLSSKPSAVGDSYEQSIFSESIRGVSRKLENAIEHRRVKVMLVTSTAAGEGKSVLSQHLAENFAYWGKRVALLDGDLRKPMLYQRFGVKKRMSLEKVLSGEEAMETVLCREQNGKLTQVLNSVPVEDPTVVINSAAMADMIALLAEQADLVIIDTPPCGQLADASLYQQYADGIPYVVQQDRMTVRQIAQAVENLYESDNKLLGYVLNGAQQTAKGYGKYGYGTYSYGKYGEAGKYGYGKYGKYGHYGSYGENGQRNRASER